MKKWLLKYNVSSKITVANENVYLWKHWYQTNMVSGQKDWMMFNNQKQERENGYTNIWKESWKNYRIKPKRLSFRVIRTFLDRETINSQCFILLNWSKNKKKKEPKQRQRKIEAVRCFILFLKQKYNTA
jgi:hypothetical protein